jgi:hypothetical protein
MTDKSQFEAMLEALINEDQETAKEIFHNIVVGKSREIYEELLESDFAAPDEEEDDEADDEAGFPDAEDDSAEDDEEDDSDESPFDMDADDEEEDEDEDGDLQDRVLDLEDALEELKAEFEELMAGEEGEPEHADMFGGEEEDEFGGEEDEFGGEPADDFGGELGDEDEEVKEVHHYHHDGDKSDKEFNEFMEYVNKVALPKHGDNGVQTRSAIAGKNDMGGTTANIAKSFSTQTGGTQGGLLNPSTQPQTGKNVNVPGAKSATKLSNVSQQPMKKSGSDTAQNKKSIVGGK